MNLYHGELDPQFGEHQEARARSLYEDKDFSKTHTVEVRLGGEEKRRRDGRGKGGMQTGKEKGNADCEWRLLPSYSNTLHQQVTHPPFPPLPFSIPFLPGSLYRWC